MLRLLGSRKEDDEGFLVIILAETKYEAGMHIGAIKDAVNRELSRKNRGVHACAYWCGEEIKLASSSFCEWSFETATYVEEAVKVVIEEAEKEIRLIKTKRQIRDAFNKCQDPLIIRQVGELLTSKGFLKEVSWPEIVEISRL